MAKKTLTVQLMELRAQYEKLSAKYETMSQVAAIAQLEVTTLREQLEAADNAAAERLGRSAQRSVQGAPVRTFRNADGVLMGKFPIGHNRFAIRPVEAA